MNNKLNIDKNWTLFLDRDGVINNKLDNDYVKDWDNFSFTYRALEAISKLSIVFGKIIIVTNQRGVGKGLMTELQLLSIHDKLINFVNQNDGRIDKIYYCTDVLETSENRKPNIGMAKNAKLDFPEIDFKRSIIIGDSESDMVFGKNLGMKRVFITCENSCIHKSEYFEFTFKSLYEFTEFLFNEKRIDI